MESWRSEEQLAALEELKERGLATATEFRVKELLRWVRNADTRQAARWRTTRFFEFARELAGESTLLEPVRKALNTFQEHLPRILRRWNSLLSNARLERINGLFQAASYRARGYRNITIFITMIYPDRRAHRRTSGREISTVNVEDPTLLLNAVRLSNHS